MGQEPFRPRAVRALALCVALALALPAVASARPQLPAPPDDPLDPAWVGQALDFQYELGNELPLRSAPWVGTHNSFNSIAEMGPTLSALDSNQQLSLTAQLDEGVRSIELDVYYLPSLEGLGVVPVVCHALDGGLGCTIEKPLTTVLREISEWLRASANRDQMLLVYLEDRLGASAPHDAAAAVLERRLGDLVYRPPQGDSCHPLPLSLTRRRALRSGAQVLLVGHCGAGEAYRSLVFDWSQHEEDLPNGFTDFPSCGPAFDRSTYDQTLVRYFEDSTRLSQIAVGATPRITTPVAAEMARCGVDLISLDQLVYPDPRLAALVWSWAPGQPGRAPCAVQRVDAVTPFGRWYSRRCGAVRRPACRSGSRWLVGSRAGSTAEAARICRADGARFAAPRTGYEAQRLRLAMRRAGVREVRLEL